MSRRRKGAKSSRSDLRIVRAASPVEPEPCDCPECSGEEFDPQQLVDQLVAGGADLLTSDDPLEAELFGAVFVAAGELGGEEFANAFANGMVPALAQQATPESLAALLALAAIDGGRAAADAARRLAKAAVPAPAWASELREPLQVGPCLRFVDAEGKASMLLCTFERAGRSHGFVIEVDHTDCDAADRLMLIPGEARDEVVDSIVGQARSAGVRINEETLDPAEFRWQVERALDARALHDEQDGGPDLDEEFDEEAGPGYPVLAALLRARLRALPEPSRPQAPHGDGTGDGPPGLAALEMLTQLAMQAQQIKAGGRLRRGGVSKLPAKRKKSGPAAPIYQIKVSLRGAKPPIWRRLELPADTGLTDLHDIIQVAFDWNDSHLHAFETAYGTFGVSDPELGHRAEASVTLEQVAPGVGDKLQYTYDFGDDWTHEILVEKVLDRGPGPYPRCTGGRRAAPPEDCGGIWGYAELVETLADPTHPDHKERLEWLGLDSPTDFDPTHFNPAEITQALTGQP